MVSKKLRLLHFYKFYYTLFLSLCTYLKFCRQVLGSCQIAYKKANKNIKKNVNQKGKEIVKKPLDNIIDRMDVNTESNIFTTIKDHKKNFLNHPKIRFINPAKNELERISKTHCVKSAQIRTRNNYVFGHFSHSDNP